MKSFSAKQIADLVGGVTVGAPDTTIVGVASLSEAACGHLSFLGNPKYRRQVLASAASIVLVPRDFDSDAPAERAWVKCDDPSNAFSVFVDEFAPPAPVLEPGVAPSAWVSPDAVLAPSVYVGANAVVEAGAEVGAGTIIEGGAYIGRHVRIGADCHCYPSVTVLDRCVLGDRVILHSGCVVGADGFGYVSDSGQHRKVPQRGIVQLDDDVELGANVTVDRARFGRTWIKRGAKVDNLVQIAHNVVVGEDSIIIAQTGIAGSTRLERGVILAGQTGVPGHVTIGEGAVIMSKSGVLGDVKPGAVLIGIPARPRREFFSQVAALKKVPEMLRDLRRLGRRLDALELQDNAGDTAP